MDQRARKLSITGAAVALFVGFIFLTRWTGDDPRSVASFDDGQKADIARFCMVLQSDYVPYETVIRVAAGQQAPGNGNGNDNNVITSYGGSQAEGDFLEGILRNLADSVPDTWAADAHKSAEGIERALHGNISEQEIDGYVASFNSLQHKAAKDCKDVKGVEVDGGGGGGGRGDRRGPFGGRPSG
jgi:hypothetical protein